MVNTVTGPPESLRTWVGCTAVPRPPIHIAKGTIDRLFKTTSVSVTHFSFPCRIVFRSHAWAKNTWKCSKLIRRLVWCLNQYYLQYINQCVPIGLCVFFYYLSWISLGTNLTSSNPNCPFFCSRTTTQGANVLEKQNVHLKNIYIFLSIEPN